MARITVERRGEGRFRVLVRDGAVETEHEVRAGDADVERYGGACTPERLIEASFEFLLEREPASAILARFELPVIEQYFPEYPRVIRERLG